MFRLILQLLRLRLASYMPPALAADPAGQFFQRSGCFVPGNEYALVNGTPTIATWTAPADGLYHLVVCAVRLTVTSGLTGGQIAATVVEGGVNIFGAWQLLAASEAAGSYTAQAFFLVKGGGTVSIVQGTAATAGAATVAANITALN